MAGVKQKTITCNKFIKTFNGRRLCLQ